MGKNETIHKTEENKDIERLQGCFYRGHVRGDDHSVVTVSLCEGMVRHFYLRIGIVLQDPFWVGVC